MELDMNGWKLAGMIGATLATILTIACFSQGYILAGIAGLVAITINVIAIYMNS